MAKTTSDSSSHFFDPASKSIPPLVRHHHIKALSASMKGWQNTHEIPPVLLLTGQPGIGKRVAAYALAQWILCRAVFKKESFLEGCGQCESCTKFISGSSVDFIEISSMAEDQAIDSHQTLKIEQFRKLKSTLGFGAHDGNFKVVLISHADRMTVQAANSVLKLLEDPPKGWVFILTADDSSLLLPTLVSRCQTIRLRPFISAEIKELLDFFSITGEKQEICAEIAQGSWKRALSLSGNEFWEDRKALFHFLKDPLGNFNSMMDWSLENSSHLDLLIDLLEQLSFDLIQWTLSAHSTSLEKFQWTHSDCKNQILAYAHKMLQQLGSVQNAREFWIEQSERLAQARQEVALPLNRKLFVQDLLLPWIRVSA